MGIFGKKDPQPVKEARESSEEDEGIMLRRNASDIEMDSDDLSGELCYSDDEQGAQRRGMLKAQKN